MDNNPFPNPNPNPNNYNGMPNGGMPPNNFPNPNGYPNNMMANAGGAMPMQPQPQPQPQPNGPVPSAGGPAPAMAPAPAPAPAKKSKAPLIIIIAVVAVIIIGVVAVLALGSKGNDSDDSGNGDNSETSSSTTGNKEEESTKVTFSEKEILGDFDGELAYSCTQSSTNDEKSTDAYIYALYHKNGYESRFVTKIVVNYKELTDDDMLTLLKDLDPYGGTASSPNYEKFNVNGTTELGLVGSLGLDTTVTRNGNQVIYSYYTANYNSFEQLTKEDKETVKKSLVDAGFTCK